MSDNSRVRVSIVGVVIVALFSALLARLWFLQMGAEAGAPVPGGRAQHAGWCRPNRRAAASSTATATCSPRTSRRGRSPSTARSTKTTRARVHRPALRGARAAVHGRAAGTELQRPAPVAAQARDRRARRARDRPGSRSSSTIENYPGVERPEARPCGTIRTASTLAAQVLGYVGEIADEQLEDAASDAGYQEGDDDRAGRRRGARTSRCCAASRGARRSRSIRPATGRRTARCRSGHGRQRRQADDRRRVGRARPSSRSRRASSPRASNRTRTSRTSASRT